MYCNKCGAKIEMNAEFCSKCGNKVNSDKTVSLEQNQSDEQANANPKKKGKSRKRGVLLAIIGTLTAAAITGGIFVYPLLNKSIKRAIKNLFPTSLYMSRTENCFIEIFIEINQFRFQGI
ncbi:MAG TPA: hypothetical protein DD413_09130 [Ruminococcus sp.]|nr:hypothetical protein [Ruminococcus sp.]